MPQGYYSLQEAARFLGMTVEELRQLAQKGQIRSFQDRGTLRFRTQDVQELARARGAHSDTEVPSGGPASPSAKSPALPRSGAKKTPASPKSPPKKESVPEVFDFDVNADSVDLGADIAGGPKSKPSSHGKKVPTPPPASADSDSDVRLVADGSDVTFSIPKDSDIKLADSDVKISPDPLKPKTGVHRPPPGSGGKRPSQLALGSGSQPKSKLGAGSDAKPSSPRPGNTPQPVDSGVRLVPMDSDSDVKLMGTSDEVALGEGDGAATDSNVRLERVDLPPADSQEGALQLTEEINLDEEIRKQQEKEKDQPRTKVKAKSELKLPATSPFELSDSDLELPSELKNKSGPKTPKKAVSDKDSSDFEVASSSPTEDGSSDFDLVPSKDESILLEGDSDDFSLEASDEADEVLHEERTELTSSTSGISLDNPADAGISLEATEDASDFDLSLEPGDTPRPMKSRPIADSDSEFELSAQKTPKPAKSRPAADDSDSEFDLSLDPDALAAQGDDSEFELSLESVEGEMRAPGESDSEFELTLDDSGSMAVIDDEEAAPQVKSKKKKGGSSGEQDIFDTDFEVPALEGSDEATVADSELESSDFDLALDDSELASEEESGSQVVALDEEDAETIVDEDADAAVADDVEVEEESSDFADLDEDVQVEEEDEEEVDTEAAGKRQTVVKEVMVQPAPWGIMPVVFMLPCVIIMFLVGILGYEMVQTSAGLKPPGPMTIALGDLIQNPVLAKK